MQLLIHAENSSELHWQKNAFARISCISTGQVCRYSCAATAAQPFECSSGLVYRWKTFPYNLRCEFKLIQWHWYNLPGGHTYSDIFSNNVQEATTRINNLALSHWHELHDFKMQGRTLLFTTSSHIGNSFWFMVGPSSHSRKHTSLNSEFPAACCSISFSCLTMGICARLIGVMLPLPLQRKELLRLLLFSLWSTYFPMHTK